MPAIHATRSNNSSRRNSALGASTWTLAEAVGTGGEATGAEGMAGGEDEDEVDHAGVGEVCETWRQGRGFKVALYQ